MLTEERMQEIDKLVEEWEHKESQKVEFPCEQDYRVLCELLNNPCGVWNEKDSALLERASLNMNVTIEELKEWFEQWQEEVEADN